MCLFVAFTTNAEKIKGNGNVITKEVAVSDFSAIEFGCNTGSEGNLFGKAENKRYECLYSQTTGKSSLSITIDENLFPVLDIESNGGKLTIKTKGRDRITPSTFIVKASSGDLNKVSISGLLDFTVKTPFRSDNLKMSISGACNVTFEKQADLGSFHISVGGAGDLKANEFICKEFESSISGAGNVNLKGRADRARFSVSGAGNVNAFDFDVKDVSASVSGAGNVNAYASEKLEASTSGVGNISYKGDAETKLRKSGLGSISKK